MANCVVGQFLILNALIKFVIPNQCMVFYVDQKSLNPAFQPVFLLQNNLMSLCCEIHKGYFVVKTGVK